MLDDTAINSSAFINSIFILSPVVFYYILNFMNIKKDYIYDILYSL